MKRHIQATITEEQYRQFNMARYALGLSMDTFITRACEAFITAHSEELLAQPTTLKGEEQ